MEKCHFCKEGECQILSRVYKSAKGKKTREAVECGGHTDDCVFFATDDGVRSAREKSNQRLRSLPPVTQRSISEKFYERRTPWQDET